ncbi:hypothetical protein N7512_004893 [Penicillium capsulatum]|nr:hypothetical protein N7512_004893 [Penicillium capsulatum]
MFPVVSVITVNVTDEESDSMDEELKMNPEVQAQIDAFVPVKRPAESEEVGDAITYLLSPAASYINSTSLVIDAAITARIRLHQVPKKINMYVEIYHVVTCLDRHLCPRVELSQIINP